MKAPFRVSDEFAKGARAVRCVEVVTRDNESFRGFVLGALSCVVIVAGIAFFVLSKVPL